MIRRWLGLDTEAHRQIYYGARMYPLAMWHSGVVGFMLGLVVMLGGLMVFGVVGGT